MLHALLKKLIVILLKEINKNIYIVVSINWNILFVKTFIVILFKMHVACFVETFIVI